jgi:hypothetical protein
MATIGFDSGRRTGFVAERTTASKRSAEPTADGTRIAGRDRNKGAGQG